MGDGSHLESRGDQVRKLVDAFLRRYQRWSQVEVADRVDGVTQKDVSRWRRDAYQPEHMTYAKERALVEEMERAPPRRRET